MACACKATEQISYLQKRYGVNQPKQKMTDFAPKNPWGVIKDLTVVGIVALLWPIMLLHVIFTNNSKKKVINIAKVFGLKPKKA